MDDLSPKQCICTNLHINCNPDTCIQAARRKAAISIIPPIIQEEASELLLDTTLESIRRAMSKGCVTCTLIFGAVTADLQKEGNRHLKYYYKEILVRFHSRRRCLEIWTQGYDVKSQDGDEYHVIYDMTTYRLPFVEIDYWEICQAFAVRPIRSRHTNSQASLAAIKTWIQECEIKNVCRGSRIHSLPRRVIDVGLLQHSSQKFTRLHLYESECQRERYTALSHCWGEIQVITTTKPNLKAMKRDIPWSGLSKTFQDAITITRKLGIQYIWIDSLCIVQDDMEDWKTESSKMESIYSNSFLTINASSAKDGSVGCLYPTKALASPGTEIEPPDNLSNIPCIYVDEPFPHNEIWKPTTTDRSSLDHRAWALQERLMSSRTLHCTSNELIWECYCSLACQCGLVNLTCATYEEVPLKQRWYQTIFEQDTYTSLAMLWEHLVEEYSARHLTWDKDRLVAISGLTNKFKERGKGRYLAGLWQPSLHKEMLWTAGYTDKPEYDMRSRLYTVPSWSWASMRGFCFFPAGFEYHQRRHFMAQILKEEIAGASEDESILLQNASLNREDKYTVPRGYLTIAGKHIVAKVLKFDADVEKAKALLVVQVNGHTKVLPYFQDDTGETSDGDKVICVLWSVAPDRTRPKLDQDFWDYGWSTYALVLSRLGKSACYRRVGLTCLTWSFTGFDDKAVRSECSQFKKHKDYDLICSSGFATAKELFKNSSLEVFEIH